MAPAAVEAVGVRCDPDGFTAWKEGLNIFRGVSSGLIEVFEHVIVCVMVDVFFEREHELADIVQTRQDTKGGVGAAIVAGASVAARDVVTIGGIDPVFMIVVVEHWIVIEVFDRLSFCTVT